MTRVTHPHYGDFDPMFPSDEELQRLEDLKQKREFESGNLQCNAFDLAQCYYEHGAMYAARFWAHIWLFMLWLNNGEFHEFNGVVDFDYLEETGPDDWVVAMYG